MGSERRKLNAIRGELHAIRPDEYVEPLPPQPSIQPGLPADSILVRSARKLDRLANQHPLVKRSLRAMNPIVYTNRLERRKQVSLKRLSFSKKSKVKVSIIILAFNKYEITRQCLQSIHDNVPTSIPFEVILLDNGSSDAVTRFERVAGLRYVRSETNLGFVGGCNMAASNARGKYLVFLNNDAVVTSGWLESLVSTIETYPKAGIVGSKINYPDGRLQEAGGIIFKDGTGNNYGKNDHPDRYQYNYVREVDYCSGASIIIKRSIFKQLRGFDVLYQPAYYEDTDLAFRVRSLGLRVLYQPNSVIYHIEGATAGTSTESGFKKYQAINHEKFVKRWVKKLQSEHYPPNQVYPARDRSSKKLFLIIDEHVPTPDQDAGSVRMAKTINILQQLGYKVTFFPNYLKHRGKYTEKLQQQGVEVVYGPVTFESFIEQYGKYYDGVMLSRPRIGSYYLDLCQAYCTKATIIYDTVDLHYLRLGRQAAFESGELKKYYERMSKLHEQLEHYLIHEADVALVVSDYERALLEAAGHKNIAILSTIHALHEKTYAAGFSDRKDILFVGGFQHPPNGDAIKWFVDSIFPNILKNEPQIKLHVVGSAMPDSLKAYLQKRDNVIVHGFVENLEPLLASCRVFVAPMRYGAGVKGKIGTAIEHGLPVITTTIGEEGMHLKSGISCLSADTAGDFEAAVLRLYNDKELWNRMRVAAAHVLEEHFSIARATEQLKKILA